VVRVICGQVHRRDAADQVRQAQEFEAGTSDAGANVDYLGGHLVANCSRYELHRATSYTARMMMMMKMKMMIIVST